MKIRSQIVSVLAAGAFALAMVPSSIQATATIQISSGADTITIADGSTTVGSTDGNPNTGGVSWLGTINGWTLSIAVGDTKPLLGTAAAPAMDLGVSSPNAGSDNLVVKFSDTGFGPSSGSLVNAFFQNGTGAATHEVLLDTSNGLFTGAVQTSPFSVNLLEPYSLTLVDTFTPGTISSDDRLSLVPDGGTTVALMGFALVGIAGLRRRLTK